ncbi:Uncharacterized conserved protein, DUF362 family [Desulfacinum hydrothermale DSM 13146]|uniref:Uncharacterized conserved protein, DUF362 family n=1 Tax=Desulfacinum hydrothermale DSM 13146 TaxID=1121390 RepID=A0A1W1XF83_9BACT|nr:DUF362 domain-containing protein [Desulfacinum hydrothermale]SMC22482.1 Uncharacterized conserved protein, DUF362 family [Desulfacinum hydrothermale DSM 13146]
MNAAPSHTVALETYEKPVESVARVIEAAGGFPPLGPDTRVFIKPNVVTWTPAVDFPKWGVITTSRVVEDVVRALHDAGARRITLGEGLVSVDPREKGLAQAAFTSLGYFKLADRYGIQVVDVFQRPFRKVAVADGISLNFNRDALESDLIVDLPVLKTHAQTVVSLGIKNLKGLIDMASRKRCHSADPQWNLHRMVAALPAGLPPVFTVIDGIFSNERGPAFDGTLHRMNVLVASRDLLSADMVGARLLGHHPDRVPHLVHAARAAGRPLDLSDVRMAGESLDSLARPHDFSFPYTEDGSLPALMEQMGIRGLSYPKYDDTLCTYCSMLNGLVLTAVARAWSGSPWDEVEVLTGKAMQPTPGKKHTILLGKCMSQAHKNNPNILHPIPVPGCPPKPGRIAEAFREAGIPVDASILESWALFPGRFVKKYAGKDGFDEAFFRIP